MSKPYRISKRSREVLEMLAETVVPSEPGRPGAAEMKLVDRILDFLSQWPGAVAGFAIYCRLWEWSPVFTGRFSRLSKLAPEERTAVLEKYERSSVYSIRMSFMGVKGIMLATFYNNPDLWPAIGYKQGCLSEAPNPIPDL